MVTLVTLWEVSSVIEKVNITIKLEFTTNLKSS